MDTKICPRCGMELPLNNFYTYNSGKQAGKSMSYCKSCHKLSVLEWSHKTGIRRPRDVWAASRRNGVERVCEQCGKRFIARHRQVLLGQGKFCSKQCAGYAAREMVERKCKFCGKVFQIVPAQVERGRGTYCSRRCQGDDLLKRVQSNCPQCGKEIEAIPSRFKNGGKAFCSRACYEESIRGAGSRNWRGGSSFEPYCPKFNNKLKAYIRHKFNYRCVICGNIETTTRKDTNCTLNLAIHHVDYNKLQGCQGRTWALVPMCHRDHAKTNGDRWYWFALLINYWAVVPDVTLRAFPFCSLTLDLKYAGIG